MSIEGAADRPGVEHARAAARLAKVVEVALVEVDLTLPQYRMLAHLAEGSGGASALAGTLAVSRPSITALADGLVARGLVERCAHAGDRRRVDHLLTPDGRAALAAGDEAVERRLADLVLHLPRPQRRRALDGLARWLTALDAAREAAGRPLTSTLERDLTGLAGGGAGDGPGSPFEPLAVEARSGPPLGHVDPDQSKGWLAWVRPLLAARKVAFISALVAALVAMVAQVAVPRVTMGAIDSALTEQTSPLAPFVWMLLALALVRGVLTYVYRLTLYRVAYDLEYDLRVGIYEHLTRMSFSFYDRVQTGQLISRANSDIRSIQMFLTFAPLMVLNMASFAVAFALMLAVHVPLALVALAPLPFVYVAGRKLRDLLFPISWIVQARQADVATIVEENVTGARVVKSFAAEARQVGLLAGAAEKLRWAAVRQIDARAHWAPVMENLPRLGMAGVLLYGGWLAIDGQVTVGTIVAFSTYVVLLQAPFRMLGFLMMLSQRAAASASRIFEILDTAPDVADRPGAIDLLAPEGRVELDDVTFGYGEGRPVLAGFDLTVEPGEAVAIVGRTGSGKSTVARLLCRFYDVDAGAVRIDGHDVRDLTSTSLRAAVGVVLDEPFLFSVSVRDNIAYARPGATQQQVEAAARAAQADRFVEALPDGYDTLVGERGYTLSGGQRQRIAIARTLLADPRVLVLDDATSAIDVRVEEEIHDALRLLLAGRTTLVIAHRLSTIGLADRVVLIEGGRVVASGTHTELLTGEPRYAAVLASIEHEAQPRADDLVGPGGEG